MKTPVNIEDFIIPCLIHDTRKTRSSRKLIKHLRSGGEVTPELALFIADILDAKVNVRNKPIKMNERLRIALPLLDALVDFYRELLQEGGLPYSFDPNEEPITWQSMGYMLKDAGYDCGKLGVPETKGKVTLAAELLACKDRGITRSQLKEARKERSSARKNRGKIK